MLIFVCSVVFRASSVFSSDRMTQKHRSEGLRIGASYAPGHPDFRQALDEPLPFDEVLPDFPVAR